MVVNDFDLKSSAKLAESSLLSSNNIQSHLSHSGDPMLEKCVDLCLAVNTASEFSAADGLYDPDDELLKYCKGQTRRMRMLKTTTTTTSTRSQMRLRTPYSYTFNGTEARHIRGRPRIGKKTISSSFRSVPVPVPLPPASQPVFYESCDDYNVKCSGDGSCNQKSHVHPGQLDAGVSPEERAARRGLITAALSQLESIVCRVAYVLKDDRNSDEKSPHVHLRLTSNSFDVRNRWLPLVEGLGLAGLVQEQEQISMDRQCSSTTDECDSNSHDPPVFPSVQREISGSSSNIAVVSPIVGKEDDNQSRMLEGLLRSAHPLQASSKERDCYALNDVNLSMEDQEEPLFQSIVITAAHDKMKAPTKFEDEVTKPVSSHIQQRQPKAKNNTLENEFIRDHLLLEIAAGSQSAPSSCSLSSEGNTSTTVIFPGSLRKRGEFCLVDLVLDDEIEATDMGAGNNSTDIDLRKPQRSFRWRVEETHFHRLESEEETRDWA